MTIVDQKEPFKTFGLMDDLNEDNMKRLLSWLRLVEFEGDPIYLY